MEEIRMDGINMAEQDEQSFSQKLVVSVSLNYNEFCMLNCLRLLPGFCLTREIEPFVKEALKVIYKNHEQECKRELVRLSSIFEDSK